MGTGAGVTGAAVMGAAVTGALVGKGVTGGKTGGLVMGAADTGADEGATGWTGAAQPQMPDTKAGRDGHKSGSINPVAPPVSKNRHVTGWACPDNCTNARGTVTTESPPQIEQGGKPGLTNGAGVTGATVAGGMTGANVTGALVTGANDGVEVGMGMVGAAAVGDAEGGSGTTGAMVVGGRGVGANDGGKGTGGAPHPQIGVMRGGSVAHDTGSRNPFKPPNSKKLHVTGSCPKTCTTPSGMVTIKPAPQISHNGNPGLGGNDCCCAVATETIPNKSQKDDNDDTVILLLFLMLSRQSLYLYLFVFFQSPTMYICLYCGRQFLSCDGRNRLLLSNPVWWLPEGPSPPTETSWWGR